LVLGKWVMVLGGIVMAVVGVGLLWPKPWFDPRGGMFYRKEGNLEKYDFDSLRRRGGLSSEIVIGGPIKAVETRRQLRSPGGKVKFTTREIFFTSNGKRISGMMNYYPERSSLSKVIIMIRGYAEKEGYYPGSGTWAVADRLADEGYVTISLDFLGYADSEAESVDPLEARFEKVESVMDLIESVKKLAWVDKNKIGIWAHSNGGQIALSVLEVTGSDYPTVLWAPMTNPFPQSLIDTADEGEEKQKAMDYVSSFLKYYDGRRYAFENYYEWVKAPMLIQQGTADSWCRVEWQTGVVSRIKSFGGQAELVIYEDDDHNLKRNWEEAVTKDIAFFGGDLR